MDFKVFIRTKVCWTRWLWVTSQTHLELRSLTRLPGVLISGSCRLMEMFYFTFSSTGRRCVLALCSDLKNRRMSRLSFSVFCRARPSELVIMFLASSVVTFMLWIFFLYSLFCSFLCNRYFLDKSSLNVWSCWIRSKPSCICQVELLYLYILFCVFQFCFILNELFKLFLLTVKVFGNLFS